MIKYIGIIILLSLALYANSLSGEFISDDLPQITNNPAIGNLLEFNSVDSYLNSLIYKAAGLNSWPYHLLSIILYSVCCVLIFFFLRYFFSDRISFLGGLLFVLHPLHAEAVSWISARPYLISGILMLSSFILYQKSFQTKRRSLYAVSLALQILNFYTCWYAIFFPGMIITYDLIYGKIKERWKFWPGYIVLILGLTALAKTFFLAERIASFHERLGTSGAVNPYTKMLLSLFTHLRLFFWPQKLSFYHDEVRAFPALLPIGSVFLGISAVSLPFLFKKAKPILFGLGLFVLFLIPTFSPFPLSAFIAERHALIPSLGLCMVLAFVLARLLAYKKTKYLTYVLLGIVLIACALRVINRNREWRTEVNFWEAALASSPNSSNMAINLANTYQKFGRLQEAIVLYNRVIKADPNCANAYYNLGVAYYSLGQTRRAAALYRKTLAIEPEHAAAANNLEIIK